MDLSTLLPVAVLCGVTGLFMLVFLFRYQVPELVFLGAAVLPMIWLARLNSIQVTVGDMPLVLLWAVFAFLLFAGLIAGNRSTRQVLNPGFRRVGMAMALMLFTMFITTVVNSAGADDILRGLIAILFVVLPLLAAWGTVCFARIGEAGARKAVLSLFLAGNFLAGMSILSAVAPGLFRSFGVGVSHEVYGESRAYSPLGGANGTGMVLAMLFCLALGQLLAKRQILWSVITLALAFMGTLATLSRGPMLGLVLGSLFLLVSHRRGLGRRLAMILVIGVIVLIPVAYKLSQYQDLERFSGISGASFDTRSETMRTSLTYFARHPMFGGGWGLVYEKPRERFAYDVGSRGRFIALDGMTSLATPHSLPALVLVESGAVGFVAFLGLLWVMWKQLQPPDPRKDLEGAHAVGGFRAALLSFYVTSLVQDSLFLADKVAFCFYLMMVTGILVAAQHRFAAAHAATIQGPAQDLRSFALPSGDLAAQPQVRGTTGS